MGCEGQFRIRFIQSEIKWIYFARGSGLQGQKMLQRISEGAIQWLENVSHWIHGWNEVKKV